MVANTRKATHIVKRGLRPDVTSPVSWLIVDMVMIVVDELCFENVCLMYERSGKASLTVLISPVFGRFWFTIDLVD